jgi:phage gp29-like protein
MARKIYRPAKEPANVEQPVARQGGDLAPWPSSDRFPTVIGSSLTLQYISNVFRTCQTGYRREYVDVLDELIERDPNAFAVMSQRILAVAGGKLSMVPAKTETGNEERAKEIAHDCERAVQGIDQRVQAFASLLWGVYYGVSASEINWDVSDSKWSPRSLSWIHSRRLAYPDPSDWKVRIWDLGMLVGWGKTTAQFWGKDSTALGFGLSPYDFPGKFIIHQPQLRGDYPTRDGLGREMAYWMAIKLMGARNLASFVERFGKPWPIGYYATTKEGKEMPRAATNEDIQALEATMLNIGAGSLSGAALPNSVWSELSGPTAGNYGLPPELPQEAIIRIADSQIAKAVLGQDDTTSAGPNGGRASTETRKAGTLELYRYDAACLSDTIKRDLIWWYVHLNYPGEEHLCPSPHIDIEPPLDRAVEAKIIVDLVTAGAPLDAEYAVQRVGYKNVPNDTDEPRRLFLNKGTENPSFFDSETRLTPEAEQLAKTADKAAAAKLESEKVRASAKSKKAAVTKGGQ